MDSKKRYQKAKTIFAKAGEGDQELLKLVQDLVASDQNAASFIEQPIAAVSTAQDPVIGTQIGPYQIKRQLGRGGMGVVYLAIRADDFRKQVAIKLVKRGMDSEEILKRFQNERQALAALEHPNIARLLDGGTTKDGLQYFVMEYIEGTPIDEYCDKHKLKTLDRLKLFCKVCSAVQFAHQNLIVHRDLKPANILVTEEGEPKLLDFGIAKLLNPDLSVMSAALTKTGMQIMTPEYASPEQVKGLPITTTSDVYALGVLLYELLTGHKPYRLKNRSKHEIERVICEEEPTSPSTVIGRTEEMNSGDETTKITPETVSTNRDGKPGLLRKRLSGDIDNIVLFALRKEPERRYGSAEKFSDDIYRHLDGLPVNARKATTRYRAGKFIRRNRLMVTAASLIALSLLGGILTTTWQARVAAKERDNARVETTKAEKVSEFLVDIFEAADPYQAQGDTITAGQILEVAANKIETELKDQPEVQAMLLNAIGHIYAKLGRYNDALSFLQKGLDIRKNILSPDHNDLAESYMSLSEVLILLDNYVEAEEVARQAVRIQSKNFSENDPEFAKSLVALGGALFFQDDLSDAKPFLQRGLSIYERSNSQDEAHANSLFLLGRLLRDMGNYAESESLLVRSVAMQEKLKGEYDEDLATYTNSLAMVLHDQAKYEEAEPLYRQALSVTERNLGPKHPAIVYHLNDLALFYQSQKKYAEAETVMRRALNVVEAVHGQDHINYSRIMANLASIVRKQSKLDESESLYRRALKITENLFGPDYLTTGTQIHGLAITLEEQRKYDDSERLYLRAIEIYREKQGKDKPYIGMAMAGLAGLYNSTGQFSLADSLYLHALKNHDANFGVDHPKTLKLREEYQEMTEKLRTANK